MPVTCKNFWPTFPSFLNNFGVVRIPDLQTGIEFASRFFRKRRNIGVNKIAAALVLSLKIFKEMSLKKRKRVCVAILFTLNFQIFLESLLYLKYTFLEAFHSKKVFLTVSCVTTLRFDFKPLKYSKTLEAIL